MPVTPGSEMAVKPSERKLKGLSKVKSTGVAISDATEYGLEPYVIGPVPLAQVREDLSVIRNSLTDTILDERAH